MVRNRDLLIGMTVITMSQLIRYLEREAGSKPKAKLYSKFKIEEVRLCQGSQ
jgi:hypothetical protein